MQANEIGRVWVAKFDLVLLVFSMRLIIALALLITTDAWAAHVKCQIQAADSIYSPFTGGKIIIDLENGIAELIHSDGEKEIRYNPITEHYVSSFRVARDSCNMGSEKILRGDGSLRAMQFRFNNCPFEQDDRYGYVQAALGFDLAGRSGRFEEMFLTATGDIPSAQMKLQNCFMQDE